MSSRVFRSIKVLIACCVIGWLAYLAVPQLMAGPVRGLVQAATTSISGNPFLFPDLTPGPRDIVDRVLRDRGGRIDRSSLPAVITDTVRLFRPDFPPDIANDVARLAFEFVMNQLPGLAVDEQTLTQSLTSAIQQAVSNRAPSRASTGYVDISNRLFSTVTWQILCSAAVAVGVAALLVWLFFRPVCPQDETVRTRWINFLISLPFLVVFWIASRYIVMGGNFSLLIASKDFQIATAMIAAAFVLAGLVICTLLSLLVLLLPYWAEQVSVFAVWRRVFHPVTFVDVVGSVLHNRLGRDIVARIIQMLVKNFPQEAVR